MVETVSNVTNIIDDGWVTDFSKSLGEKHEQAPWLIDGLLRHKTYNLLVGPPKSYKSFVVQEMAVALATGTPLFNKIPVQGKKRVLYVQEEYSDEDLGYRLNSILSGRNMTYHDLDKCLLGISNKGFRIDQANDHFQLRQLIARRQIEVVIFDPLREIHYGDEDSSTEMTPINRAFKEIRDQDEVTVVVVHHSGKVTNTKKPSKNVRGTSALFASVDGLIASSSTPTRNQRVNYQVQLRHGTSVNSFRVRPIFDPQKITFDVEIDSEDTPVNSSSTTVSFELNRKRILRCLHAIGEGTIKQTEEWTLENEKHKVGDKQQREVFSVLIGEGLVEKTGRGVKGNPYRYVLTSSGQEAASRIK